MGRYDPAAVVVCLAFDAELEAGEPRAKQGKIGHDAGCDVYPLPSGRGSGNCLDLIRRGMQHKMRAIRLRVLSDESFLPGLPVVPVIRRCLATHTRQKQHTFVASIEHAGPRRHHVFVWHIAPRPEGRSFDAPEPGAAVGGIAARVPGPQLPVQANIEQLIRVLEDQRALPRRELDAIEIMPACVAVIDLDGDIPRSVLRP